MSEKVWFITGATHGASAVNGRSRRSIAATR